MSNIPFKSSSHAAPCEWKSRVQKINNVDVAVYEPTQITTPVVVTTPSLSVGTDPTFSVDKIKRTVAEILADNIHAPITCQALINSAETAEFASTNTNGYHLLPVSGKKIHEHLSSGNMQIIKTQELDVSGNIRATGNLRLGTSDNATVDDDNHRYISTAGQLTIKSNDSGLNNNYTQLILESGTTNLGKIIIGGGGNGGSRRIRFFTSSTERMRIGHDGLVGIGTTSPSEKLDVDGNIRATGILEAHANSATAASQIGSAKIGAVSGGTSDVYFSNAASHSPTDFGLRMSSGGQTVLNSKSGQNTYFTINNLSKMMVKSDGNVGINTTSPSEKLHVVGNIKATGHLHKLESTQEQYGVVITKDNHNLLGLAGSKGAGLIIHGDATSENAYGGSLAITGAQVNQGGHGPFAEFLGSRSTYAQLASGTHTAVADGDVLGYFRWMGDDGFDCRNFAADISCKVDGTVAENKVPGAIRFRTHSGVNFTERMRLSATGNLGIGTASPGKKIDVVGGDIRTDGGIIAASSTIGSDDRLKHNEEDISNSLNVIRQLKPQKYQKSKQLKAADFNGALEEDDILCVEAGFIAQDIQTIPELAYSVIGGDYTESTEDSEGNVTDTFIEQPYYLNYNNILTYNVAATQELDATVTALLAEVASLKERLSALEL